VQGHVALDIGVAYTERDIKCLSRLSRHSFMRLSCAKYERVTDKACSLVLAMFKVKTSFRMRLPDFFFPQLRSLVVSRSRHRAVVRKWDVDPTI
jgi:hypothetical protein